MINNFFKIILFFLLIILVFLKPEPESILDSRKLLIYSAIFLGSVFLHLYKYSSDYKNWFRLDVFFLLGMGIVHFQWPIMFSMSGISPELAGRVWVAEEYVNYGTWLSTMGILAWIFGFSFLQTEKHNKNRIWHLKYNRLLNFTIFLFISFLLTAGKDFLTGGVYKGSGTGTAGAGISAFIGLLFSITIILLTVTVILANKQSYKSNLIKWFFNLDKRFLFVFFVYITLFLLIGDRGGPIALLLTVFIMIGTIIRPISFVELTVSVVFGAIVMTIISLGRGEVSGIGIFNAGAEKFSFSSGYDITLELANSVRTLYTALMDVPHNHGYFYGSLWTADLLAPIPFLQSFYVDLFGIPYYEIGSGQYITYLTYGVGATSGEGTSLIADIFLNFSSIGVIIFMFLFGMFFKKSANELNRQNNFNWIITAAILASLSFYFGRSGLFISLRPIIWSLVMAAILVKNYKYSK